MYTHSDEDMKYDLLSHINVYCEEVLWDSEDYCLIDAREALREGVVTIEDMVQAFRDGLDEYLKSGD